MSGLRTREKLNAVNGADFECNIGTAPVIFKIDPQPDKLVDLSSVTFTAWLDSNAVIGYRPPMAPGNNDPYVQRLQTSDHSFTYPGGVASLFGRVRIETNSGLILEEIEAVNVLAQTRVLSLSEDEALMLARDEVKNIQTNYCAFNGQTATPTVLGYGNTPESTTLVRVNHLNEFRFKFGSLGGFMNGREFPLSEGLTIYIYFAEFTDQRVYSGAYMDQQARLCFTYGATGAASGGIGFDGNIIAPSSANFNAITDMFTNNRQFMISGIIDETVQNVESYGEEAGFIFSNGSQFDAWVSPGNGSINITGARAPGAQAPYSPYDLNGVNCTLSPVDFVTKLTASENWLTDIDGTTPDGVKWVANMSAHSAGIKTLPQNGSAALVLNDNAFNIQAYGATQQYTPRSVYGHLGLYPNRLVKIVACEAGDSTVYQYDIRKITSITYNSPNFTVTLDANFNWGAAPTTPVGQGQGNPPVGSLGLISLCGPADLKITGSPYIRRAAIEFETVPGKVSKTMVFESKFIRGEIYNILAKTSDLFLTTMIQSKVLDGIVVCCPFSNYDLDTFGYNTVLPLLNGKNLTDQPIRLKSSLTDKATPNEVVYMYEMATGAPVKRPSLMAYLGQGYDYVSLPCLSAFPTYSDTVFTQDLKENFISSCAYAIGIPCNGVDTYDNRIQLRFSGTSDDSQRTLYIYHLHRKDITVKPDGRITVSA